MLYGVVTALAFQEPTLAFARTQTSTTRVASIVPAASNLPSTKIPISTLGQIAAPPALIAPTVPLTPQPRVANPARIVKRAVHARREPSVFQREQSMSHAELMTRWEPLIKKAARRFTVPASWIREVMRIESGGRTMMAENTHIVSSQGALGLMQVQPGTYAEMRMQYRLGPDPFDPHDNIFAGAAYLRWLRGKYGFPTMFEAYDDGPGNLEQRTAKGVLLPAETRNYVSVISLKLGVAPPAFTAQPNPATLSPTNTIAESTSRPVTLDPALTTSCNFTRPDGSPLAVDCTQVTSVRQPLLSDFSATTQSIITVASVDQRIRESEYEVRRVVLAHGGHV